MADGSTRREFLAGTGRAALGLTLLPVARGSAAAPSDPEKRPLWIEPAPGRLNCAPMTFGRCG